MEKSTRLSSKLTAQITSTASTTLSLEDLSSNNNKSLEYPLRVHSISVTTLTAHSGTTAVEFVVGDATVYRRDIAANNEDQIRFANFVVPAGETAYIQLTNNTGGPSYFSVAIETEIVS